MGKAKVLLLIVIFVLSSPVYAQVQKNIKTIGWGGGGAFTSTIKFNDTTYLSSDVTGVWKQEGGRWQPFVEGLNNYNVTALVSFNQWLFAITTDELFVSDGKQKWISTRVKLDTYRSVTNQVYSISTDGKLLCIANRNQKVKCIDNHNHVTTFPTPEKVINGVYFDNADNHLLYFFSGSKLFTFNTQTSHIALLKNFANNIISLASYNGHSLIATNKNIFAINDLKDEVYSSTKIVNFFVINQGDGDIAFISNGNRWSTQLKSLSLEQGSDNKVAKVKISFDLTLPHRPYQKSLTKFLSVNQFEGKAWLTDYWGVYQLDFSGKTTLIEVTDNAINTVATDLAITDTAMYISTMDNGIVKTSQPTDLNNTKVPPKYTALAFDKLKGHSWSLLHHDNTVYGVISPWDNANDYLFEYSEMSEKSKVTKLTDYKTRKTRGAFWGKGYSRQLVYYNGILSFRDGKSGGLVKNKGNTFDSDEPDRLGHLNRVYRAIATHNDLLYIASCEGTPRILAIDNEGDLKVLEDLPSGFCPFTLYSHQNSLYLLGSRKGQSVVYQLEGDELGLLYTTPKGSAFYQMAINPNNSKQIVAATISWSNRATSGLFVSNDGGQTFADKSCLLTHKNGVVALRFDNDTVYILQKVGGGIATSNQVLFSTGACTGSY